MRSACPRWPVPDATLCARDPIFWLVTAWLRGTYPARLAGYRAQYAPRMWKEVATQRYVDLPPAIDIVGWRKALQGVE